MKLLWSVAAPHVMQSVANTIVSGHDVEIIWPSWIIDPSTVNTGSATVHVVANPDDLLNALDRILASNQIDYLVPSFPDAMTEKIAEICQRHTVAFVGKSTARMLSSKYNYYRLWKALSIPVPAIYNEISQVTLPCIVKPYRGQASNGVKILTNTNEIAEFFVADEYIVQQYIPGDIVSFVGTVVDGRIDIDLCYDIESDAFPYVPETGLSFPSKYSFLQQQVTDYLRRFFDVAQLNNVPFMLDIVVDANGQFYFIDFAARLSMGGLLLMSYGGENNYVSKVLARMHQEQFVVQLTGAVLFRQLGLPCGDIKEIYCENSTLAAKLELPKQVVVADHDNCVYPNGYAIIVGDNRDEVEDKFRKCVDSISVEYYNT